MHCMITDYYEGVEPSPTDISEKMSSFFFFFFDVCTQYTVSYCIYSIYPISDCKPVRIYFLVPEVSMMSQSYPNSEQPGQLYAYRISQSEVILRTRHMGPVGIQSVADGSYKCVARNLDKTNNNNVSVQTKG